MAATHSWIPISTGQLSDTNWIREGWDRLRVLPGGSRMYSALIGRMVPYSGSVRPHVLELRKGYAKVQIPDRRSNRNHLSSVHAIALANLAELAANLALVYSLPSDARFIVRGFDIEYQKKSRGVIAAEGTCPEILTNEKADYETKAVLKDASGDVVAKAIFRSRVGPKKR